MGSDKKTQRDQGFEIKTFPKYTTKHDRKNGGGREQAEDELDRAFNKMDHFETKYVVLNDVQPKASRTSNDTRFAVKI